MKNRRWSANVWKSITVGLSLAIAASATADEVGGEEVVIGGSQQASSGGTVDRVMAPVVSAGSALLDTVYIHGFGGWAYGTTFNEPNLYREGDPDGKFDNLQGGIVIGARPTDLIRIHSQIFFDNSDVRLNYLFAELSMYDELVLRAGKFSQPFGLYSEILEIGTLRPLYGLPLGVYGDSGFTAISVSGGEISGDYEIGGGWTGNYSAYAGGGEMLEGISSLEGGDGDSIEPIAGGRIQIMPPIDGLLVGLAGYWGRHDGIEFSLSPTGYFGPAEIEHGVLGTQLQYLQGPYTLRFEYYHQWEDEIYDTDVLYVEGAYSYTLGYRFLESIQLALRYDYSRTKINLLLPPPQILPFQYSVLDHDDVTVGLNFWASPNLVLKLNYSHVWGNRFAYHEGAEITDPEPYVDETDFFLVGVQFSF